MKKYLNYLWMLFLITGCSFQPISTPDFPYELMLQATDLPNGFERTGGSFPEVPDAFSHMVGFSSDPDVIGKGISHRITIYPDVDSAKDSFVQWERESFTQAWLAPSVIYTPMDVEDQAVLKCMNVQINDGISQSCRFLQQHNNLIILVLANIDSAAINYDEFLKMLQNLDKRLPTSGEVIALPSE